MLKRQLFKQYAPESSSASPENSKNQEDVNCRFRTIGRSKGKKFLALSCEKRNAGRSGGNKREHFSQSRRGEDMYNAMIDVPEKEAMTSASNNKTNCKRLKEKSMAQFKQKSVLKIKHKSKQSFVNHRTRCILIDWLSQVSFQINIHKQALHKAVCYLDKMNAKVPITKNDYQCIGLMCLFLCHKLDTRRVISFEVASHLVENALSSAEFEELQCTILKRLNFKLHLFSLWEEASMILRGFEIFLTDEHALIQGWGNFVNRVLWIVEGVTLQLSQQDKSLQTDLCLTIIFLVAQKVCENQFLLNYFYRFAGSLFQKSIVLPSLRFKAMISFWTSVECCCQQAYSPVRYHPELKLLASKFMVSI